MISCKSNLIEKKNIESNSKSIILEKNDLSQVNDTIINSRLENNSEYKTENIKSNTSKSGFIVQAKDDNQIHNRNIVLFDQFKIELPADFNIITKTGIDTKYFSARTTNDGIVLHNEIGSGTSHQNLFAQLSELELMDNFEIISTNPKSILIHKETNRTFRNIYGINYIETDTKNKFRILLSFECRQQNLNFLKSILGKIQKK